MKILTTTTIPPSAILQKIQQRRSKPEDVRAKVQNILEMVKKDGDVALFELTERFDRAKLPSLSVSPEEITGALKTIEPRLLTALNQAKRNIEIFHLSQLRKKEKTITTAPGVMVWREFRPIEKVGLYVPGGTAAYPSTVLMLAIPAKIAGCKEIILCTPPSPDGTVNPSILAAADLCGIQKIFKVGGAQAIGAMAYGTASIPKVFKIFGPGNAFVTTAKMLVYGDVDIDMPAGPSEIAVIADGNANPCWIAADLLSQLEHGPDSQALLITFSKKFAVSVIGEMQKQMKRLPRAALIQQSFQKSFAVIATSLALACDIVNEYAPEHLEIVCRDENRVLSKIVNAGSVFLGKYSSEPLGDYVTGSNHTLPTSGFAKMFPALSVESFGKMMPIQKVSRKGLSNIRRAAETIALSEGLSAHKNAVSLRFSNP